MTVKSKSAWGDRIGSQLRGPEWTPYAQAIADCYPIQIPWFYTLPSNMTTTPDRETVVTSPQQHDVLIFGAYAIVNGPGFTDEGNYILLQITHEETGIPWVVPNNPGFAPLPSIAGTVNPVAFPTFPNLTTVLKLPEVFFLPKHNRLKLDWAVTVFTNTDARITFVGVQLIGGRPPREIKMPNGEIIPLGGRLPWFITLGLGEPLDSGPQAKEFRLPANTEFVQFTTPQDCDVEIHDCYMNSLQFATIPDQLMVDLTEMGDRGIWTPQKSFIAAIAGGESQVNPALPFTSPHLLKPGHRLSVSELYLAAGGIIFQGLLTFRGVRLCRF